jgi:HAD superfamily hydrolase (TIGR01509 family)
MFEQMRLAVFDMDGLMLDTERRYYQAQIRACAERGYTVNPQMLIDAIGSRTFDLEGFFCGRIPAGENPGRFLDEAMESAIDDMCRSGVPKKKGIDELTAYLQAEGIPMIVATSTPRRQAVRLLDRAGLIGRFADIVTSSEVAHAKPQPDLFLKACARGGARPEEAVVFEDSGNGAKAAMAASIPYVLVPDMAKLNAEEKNHAMLIAEDLTEVWNEMKREETRKRRKQI